MRMNMKNLGAVLVILLLLPYLAVTFSIGPEITEETDVKMSPLEIYVCQAAAAVLPEPGEDEFIKAQMILIRTNAVRKLNARSEEWSRAPELANELGEPFLDVELTEERFGNRLYRLAKETAGQILIYQGEPIEAAYHAVSNGNTRNGGEILDLDAPYLVSVSCPEDIRASLYLARTEYETERWRELLAPGGEKRPEVEILSRDSAGYVLRVKIGEELFTGEQFRKKLGLASADFTIMEMDDTKVITTKGRGHGLGMSQYTANHMAAQGADHREILAEFFPGTELIKTE